LPNTYYSPSSQGSHIHAANHASQTQLIKGFDESNPGQGQGQGAGAAAARGALGPSGGSSASLGAQSTSSSGSAGKNIGRIESSGAWAVAYCQEAWWGECVAVSAGSQGLIRVTYFWNTSFASKRVR
jgi:nucleoporin SEH1